MRDNLLHIVPAHSWDDAIGSLCGADHQITTAEAGNHTTVYAYINIDVLKPDEEWCPDCLNHPHFGLHLLATTEIE